MNLFAYSGAISERRSSRVRPSFVPLMCITCFFRPIGMASKIRLCAGWKLMNQYCVGFFR